MARIRTIKPNMGESVTLAKVSFAARYFFCLLLCHLDDEGRIKYFPKRLAGEMYAQDEDVSTSTIRGWVEECTNAGLLVAYTSGDSEYLYSPTFLSHQKIDKPSPSKCPEPPQTEPKPVNSAKAPRILTEESDSPPRLEVGSRKEEIGNTTAANADAGARDLVIPDPPWYELEPDPLIVEVAQFVATLPPRNAQGEELLPEEVGIRKFVEFARASAMPLGEHADDAIRELLARIAENFGQDIRDGRPKKANQKPWLVSLRLWVTNEAPKWVKPPPRSSGGSGGFPSKAERDRARAREGVGMVAGS